MDGLDGVFCGSQVESSIRFEDKTSAMGWMELSGRTGISNTENNNRGLTTS